MLRELIKDITGLSSEIHMRNDAINLVTTASTTHVPEHSRTTTTMQQLTSEWQKVQNHLVITNSSCISCYCLTSL